jgi:plastocyanin
VRIGTPSPAWLATALLSAGCALFAPQATVAQEQSVTLHVKIQPASSPKVDKSSAGQDGSVVVWLQPLDASASKSDPAGPPAKRPQVVQKNKSFHPHVTVVRVGSLVDFPNHDPFFHNVFSLFDGKRFDLGLYEAGATNSVRFDHVGVSYLFCNIHPEMSAIVVAVDTPYYGVSDKTGNVAFANVPDGRYELHFWYERSTPEALKGLSRGVHISADSRDLGTVIVPADPNFTPAHKNKYGLDYAPPPKQGYSQP